MDQPFDSPQNQHIIKQQGQSITATSALASRTDLSPRDKEFTRLADAGEPFEHFETPRECSVAEADDMMLDAFGSAEYESTSPALKRLIQSGKLTNVGDAVPRKSGDKSDVPRDTTSTLSFNADGAGTKLVTTMVGAKLKDFPSYFHALLGVIIPSLIMQPVALIDWCTMSMTLMELDKKYGWSIAEQYLTKTLARAVERRLPFGRQFPQILQDIIIMSYAAPPQAPTSRAKSQQQQSPPAQRSADSTRDCTDYNFRSCTRTPCMYKHVCHFIAKNTCPTPTKPHAGKDCPAYLTATSNGVPYKEVSTFMIGGDPNYKKSSAGRGRLTPRSTKKE